MTNKDTVAIYSGGMDSFTLVNELKEEGRLHSCLSFDYGQRHVKELTYALAETSRLKVPHQIISLGDVGRVCMTHSALTADRQVEVPEGHYAADNMKLTVVPNRNAIMLSIAVAYAVSHKLARVCFGAHAGDHEIYPDCRPEFVSAMNTVALIANWHPVSIESPYQEMTKREILNLGAMLDLNYAHSWTCYKGGDVACGKCGSCQERLTAFEEIGQTDPLEYATREIVREKATHHGV